MCYRKNQFGRIVRPLRVLLTLAHSRIWPVNRFTREKNCPILLKVNGSKNEHVRWFSDPMLSKYTCTMGMGDHFCPYTQQILELVGGGIFFTSFYN